MKADKNAPFVVGYRLLDKNDQQIAQSSTLVSGDQTEVEFTKKTIQEPLQWTAENAQPLYPRRQLEAPERRCD